MWFKPMLRVPYSSRHSNRSYVLEGWLYSLILYIRSRDGQHKHLLNSQNFHQSTQKRLQNKTMQGKSRVCKFNVNWSRGLKTVGKLIQSSEAQLTPSRIHFSIRESRYGLYSEQCSTGTACCTKRLNASPGMYWFTWHILKLEAPNAGSELKNTSSRILPAVNPQCPFLCNPGNMKVFLTFASLLG